MRNKDKEKILKADKEKCHIIFKRKFKQWTVTFEML